MDNYGKELILDLHNCSVSMFNRESIDRYFAGLCNLIDMQKCERFFWDEEGVPEDERQTSPKTKGISAVQFILTSNVTLHALELMESVYVNIFSCKDFDSDAAEKFTAGFFGGKVVQSKTIERI